MSRDMDQLHYLSRENDPIDDRDYCRCGHSEDEHERGRCLADRCACAVWKSQDEPEHRCLTCNHKDWEHMRGGLCTAYGCECREWTPDDGMEVEA